MKEEQTNSLSPELRNGSHIISPFLDTFSVAFLFQLVMAYNLVITNRSKFFDDLPC